MNITCFLSKVGMMLVLAGTAIVGGAVAEQPPQHESLLGQARFSLGDDPAWAQQEFDDSQWQQVDVPGGWMAQGFASRPYVGWYRIPFEYQADYLSPALVVGQIRGAFEVYINGALIGSAGKIDQRRFYGEEPQTRVFPIPDGLLASDRSNLLALRIQRLVTDGGVKEGPLGIGDGAELSLYYETQLRRTYAWEAAFLMFYGSTLLFSIILWLLGFRDARHFWFGAVILQIGLSHLLHSNLLIAMGGLSYATTVLGVFVDQCFPVSTIMFLKHTFQKNIGKWLRLAFVGYGVVCAAWWVNIHTINALYFVWTLLSILIFSPVGLLWCLQGLRRGHPDARPLLVGSLGLFLLFLTYLVSSLSVLSQDGELNYRVLYVPLDWYAWLCVHLSMIYTLAAGYERTRRQLRKTSQRILQSHEDERKRVARELHDGVGQLLSAVKLKLDLLGQQPDLPTDQYLQQVRQSAEDTDRVFDELRRVASDLRPESLQRKGLLDAIRDLAAKVSAHTGSEIIVSANATLNGSIPGSDHIYRVVQECVNNALRHGRARQIEIKIQVVDGELQMKIHDDGVGFDAGSRDAGSDGLGLASMRERVELLGGRLDIQSRPGQGTQISVEGLPT